MIIASSDVREENRGNEEIPVFLPMYPLDGTTVIKREIAALRRAGVSPVLVMLGYQKEVLKNHLSHNKVLYVEDDQYQEHDFASSLKLGLREAKMRMDRAAVIPVEYPAFAKETLEKIQGMYGEKAPEVTLVFNFDSSGTLKTQIQEGADCDVFISAAQKQMNQLDITADPEANEEGLDFVLEGSQVNLLENKVVLAVPEGNPAGIERFSDLGTDKLGLLALGNEDVPVGQYSTEILTNLGFLEGLEADGKITYGSNVKEVTTQVSEASADAGIIYATDAFSAGLTVVDEAGADLCKQVIYPAAVLNTSKVPEAAQAFLDYLKTDACMEVFGEVGFSKAL